MANLGVLPNVSKYGGLSTTTEDLGGISIKLHSR